MSTILQKKNIIVLEYRNCKIEYINYNVLEHFKNMENKHIMTNEYSSKFPTSHLQLKNLW